MAKSAVVWSCAHASPDVSNERFDWLSKLIQDIKPDYTIDLGDGADMQSLNSYDSKYPQAIVSQSYERDIEAYNDSQDRLWGPYKHSKKRRPFRIGLEGNHCVPESTEVLTAHAGWVPIPEVKVDQMVMTMSGWQPVREVFSRQYKGDLYKFGDRSVVSYVTEGHRVYYYTSGGNLTVTLAKDAPVSLDLPVSTVTGSGIPVTDAQLRFNAVAMTDSYHSKDGRRLAFYQSGEKADTIEQIIKDAGVEYRKKVRGRAPTSICGKVLKSTQTAYEFHMLKPSWCVQDNASIPDWTFDLTEAQFEVLLETLIFCDGTIPTRATNSRVFYGKKEICDDLQAVLVTKGYRASLSEYRVGQWRVNITKTHKTRAIKQNLGEYAGKVWCISVDAKNFLMRQDNKAVFTGNCHRIKKAVALDPRLEGTKYGVSFKHLQTDHWFDEYHEYDNSAPAIVDYDGILYSHFFSSGNFGSAMSGIHHAYGLLQKLNRSATCGHSHKRSIYFKDSAYPDPLIGLVAGHFKGKDEAWAGQANREWWGGVIIKRNIENGWYDPTFVSMEALKKEYGA